MFRTFVRGILFTTVLVAIFFVIRERPSSWTLILFISMVSLALIRKEKFSKAEHSRNASEVENQEKQNVSYPLQIFEITENERSQFAVAIATSFALGNVYVIEKEIEISGIAGGYSQSLNSREPRPGRIGRVTLNSEEPLVPYEVFELLCTKYIHSVDSEFLRKIAGFGWIGYEMGSLPPSSLYQIEKSCVNSEDRRKFAGRIIGYKVDGYLDSNLEATWNRSCEILSTFVSSNQGMNAIKANEMYWLPAFSKDL